MSFDALTIGGLLAALVSGGFIVAVVKNNAVDLNNRAGEQDSSASHYRR